MHAQLPVQLFVTPWNAAHQAPLSMGFSRQEYWVGCHFLLQQVFLSQGSNWCLLHWQARSSPLSHRGSPAYFIHSIIGYVSIPISQLIPPPAFLPRDSHWTCLGWGLSSSQGREPLLRANQVWGKDPCVGQLPARLGCVWSVCSQLLALPSKRFWFLVGCAYAPEILMTPNSIPSQNLGNSFCEWRVLLGVRGVPGGLAI